MGRKVSLIFSLLSFLAFAWKFFLQMLSILSLSFTLNYPVPILDQFQSICSCETSYILIKVLTLEVLALPPSFNQTPRCPHPRLQAQHSITSQIISVLIIFVNSCNVCMFCKIISGNELDLFKATCSIIKSFLLNILQLNGRGLAPQHVDCHQVCECRHIIEIMLDSESLDQNFLVLKAMKRSYYDNDYVTLFTTIIETCGGAYLSGLNSPNWLMNRQLS